MVTKTIKLCDGWRVGFTNPLEVHIFSNDSGEYQDMREFLGLSVDSEEWNIITRQLFCFGSIEFNIIDGNKQRHCVIEVIPCSDMS